MAKIGSRARLIVVATSLSLLLAGVLAGPTVAVRPAASYTSVLTTDGACSFTLVATWPASAKVATVYGLWYLDDAFLLTTTAPFTGPNAGVIKGRTATFQTGPFTPTAESHTWRVLTQFYSAGGAQLYGMDSNTITVSCGIPTP